MKKKEVPMLNNNGPTTEPLGTPVKISCREL